MNLHAMELNKLVLVSLMGGTLLLSGCATRELANYEQEQDKRELVAGKRAEDAKAELRKYKADFRKTNQLLVRQMASLSDLEVLAARAGKHASAARAALATAKSHYAILEARLKENKNRMLEVQTELRIQELKPSSSAEVAKLKAELAKLEATEDQLKADLDVILQS